MIIGLEVTFRIKYFNTTLLNYKIQGKFVINGDLFPLEVIW